MTNRMDKKHQCLILLAMLTDLCGGNIVHCQPECFAEVGMPFVLPCGAPWANYDLYWYKGNDTSTVPILSRENGQLGGTEYDKGDLELTTEGSIRIINIGIRHEGAYTLLAFSETFERYTVTTQLTVYVPPDSRCVEVDSCPSSCSDCFLNVTGSGDLSCHVRGSRPAIDLDWIVTNQSGISFVKDQQETKHDKESGSYNTIRTIHYSVDHCGGTATIYCNASLSQRLFSSILDVNKHFIQISSETCDDITPGTTKPQSKEAISVAWPVVISVIIFLVIAVLVVCFILRKKGSGSSHETTDSEEYMGLKPSESYESRQPPRQPRRPNGVEKELIKALIKHYEEFCFIKPLPWGEPIPIDVLYTPCQCTVTTENETSHSTSEYLSTAEFNFDCRRVFITADLGYGKTTFTQHLVKRWISHEMAVKEKEKIKAEHPVLIYFHLKEVTRSMVLSTVVQRILPAGSNLTSSDIEGILRSNECHILLDGLDELSMSFQAKATPEVSGNDTVGLTIGNLLDNRINVNIYKHLRVWVTSREVDDMKAEFSLPYSKVKMLGFSRDQIIQYIHKTCKYYYGQKQIPEMALFVDDANDDISSDNATKYKAHHQLSTTTDGNEKPSFDKQKISKDICATQSDSDVVNISERKENKSEMHVVDENTEEIGEPTVHTKLLEDAQQDSNKCLPEDESNESKRKKDETSTENENKATATGNMDNGKRKALNSLKDDIINFIEVNEIVSIFSKTPLLQIMIIHIITCRILEPSGRYKEMNINKLTTITRLVITCLESKYVQKVHKDSIKLDTKTLESKLGEIAFKSKLKVTLAKKEFWESELGEEDVKTALEIGLLKYSRGAGSGSIQLEELAFSSHSGIEFYHEFFKEYLAAQYISENKTKWELLDKFIKGSGDEATVRLLQFMFGMNNPNVEKAFKTLIDERKMWNNLIDCIYEVGDPGKKRSMLVELKNTTNKGGFNMIFNIKYLERKHHSVAVSDFCKACNEHQIKITRMTFIEYCALDFLQEVTLPPLEFLILHGLTIDERDFIAILMSLGSKPNCPEHLQFIACEVPKKLSGPNLEKVSKAMKNQEMKIYKQKTKSQLQLSIQLFNVQKGKWETSYFPE